MSKNIQPIRGTRDILGNEMLLHNHVLNKAKELSTHFGYSEIITPIFEASEVFFRTLGETSDVVSKETYTFLDRDKTFITLRPEFTASIVRALISNGLTQTLPQKLFSYGPVFRHERPQKARYRQFHQINYEFIGAKTPASDAETINLAYSIIKELGIKDITLELNTLGDSASRIAYKDALVIYFKKHIKELSEDSKIRLEKNPLRILDSKDEADKEIAKNAPKNTDYMNKESIEYFDELCAYLKDLGIAFNINPKLVRGLDYYTHTVFEFTTTKLGSQGTVLAGGRYDGLVEHMGGPNIPAIGFAAGVERLSELMDYRIVKKQQVISIVPIGKKAEKAAVSLVGNLRGKGFNIDYLYDANLQKRMRYADKIGASQVVILGDDELAQGVAKIKNMHSGEEGMVAINTIEKHLVK